MKGCATCRRNFGDAEKTSRIRVGKTTPNTDDGFGRNSDVSVKALRSRIVNTTLNEGGNVARTLRKRKLTTDLCVMIVSIVEPKAVGQRTGVPATRAAEAIAARTVKRILVRVLSNNSRR